MKIITVAAGLGSRLRASNSASGVGSLPKVLHPVMGYPLAHWTYKNFRRWITAGVVKPSDFIFVVQQAHELEFKISSEILKWTHPSVQIKLVDALTDGPATTAYHAIKDLDDKEQLFINDCDHVFSGGSYLSAIQRNCLNDEKALLVGITETHSNIPSWSYAELDSSADIYPKVLSIKEKDPYLASIGAPGVIGCYGFGSKKLFNELYEDERKNLQGEFYVSNLFRLAINRNYLIQSTYARFGYPLGNLEEISTFSKLWKKLKIDYEDSTFFVDIDGLLFRHDAGYHSPMEKFEYPPFPIKENIDAVSQKYREGHHVVLTTSRGNQERDSIINYCRELNLYFHELITGIADGLRVVVNDRKPRRPSIDMALGISTIRNDAASFEILPRHLGHEITDDFTSGSGADTFRLLDAFGNSFIRKVINQDLTQVSDVLADQGRWFKRMESLIPESIPKVKNCGISHGFYVLDLDDIGEHKTLASILDSGGAGMLEISSLMEELFSKLTIIYNSTKHELPVLEITRELVSERALTGIALIKKAILENYPLQKNPFKNEDLVVNGKRMKSCEFILQKINSEEGGRNGYKNGTKLSWSCEIHGDLTGENILVDAFGRLILIDPLGPKMDISSTLNYQSRRLTTTPLFDLVKLLQTFLLGYECWSEDRDGANIVSGGFWRNKNLFQPNKQTIKKIITFYRNLGITLTAQELSLQLAILILRVAPYRLSKNIASSLYCYILATELLNGEFDEFLL